MSDITELVHTTSAHSNALIMQSMEAFGGASVDKHELAQSLFKRIDWDHFTQAGLMEHSEIQLLKTADDNLDYVVADGQNARQFAQILLKMARNVTHDNRAQQFAFTRMEEMLGLNPADHTTSDHHLLKQRAKYFQDDKGTVDTGLFMQAIRSEDPYVKKSASMALATILTALSGDVESFVAWICEQLSSGSSASNIELQAALSALCVLVRSEQAREVFVAHRGTGYVAGLLTRLGAGGSAQMAYECCFVLWVLTLTEENTQQFLTTGAVRGLIEQLAAAPSRKVVRMSLAALRNLARGQNYDIMTEMLTCNLDKYLSNMMHANAHVQANDPEVEQDCKQLYEVLMKNYRELSSYERWMAEVNSGVLRDGILHTEKFWRENVRELENEEFRMLRVLVRLLDSEDESVQIIALNDLGEFARFYPNGRSILKTIGAKDKVMEMLDQGSDELKQKALRCISKIMVTHWEYVR